MNVYIVKQWDLNSVHHMKFFASEVDAISYISELAGYNVLQKEGCFQSYDSKNKVWYYKINLEQWLIFEKEVEGSFEIDYTSHYRD